MICFPVAKINLGLSIVEKRLDGMHNIESCFVAVSLFDVMEIQPSDKFSLSIYGLPISGNPEENLVKKAWDLVSFYHKNIPPVNVCLLKAIPTGSGLGGGSSDAAFFLKSLNSLYSLGFSVSDLELLAAEIGADCPFFIQSKAKLVTGTGNIFSMIENPLVGLHITIVFSDVLISSTEAYSKVVPGKKASVEQVIRSNKSNWKKHLKNDFEEQLYNDIPEIRIVKQLLYSKGAFYVSLTGSGSAVYALSEKPLEINQIKEKYKVWTSVLN